MHTEQQIQDIGILHKGLQLLNIDVSLKPGAKLRYAVPCRFINNDDGSLRCIWPAGSREPQMLRFQPQETRKERWRARLIRAGFAMKVPGLVTSGKRVIYTTAIGQRQIQQLADWAIFTGNEGVNRKLIIWHRDKAGNSLFTKLSLSIHSAKSIYTERSAISQPGPEGIVMPENFVTRCLAFTQKDIYSKGTILPLQEVADMPLNALQRWLGYDVRLQKLSDVSWYQEAQVWLQAPKRGKDDRISEVLLQKMRTLIDCMLPQAMVPVSRAHGDFTSRNVKRRGGDLVMIDWQHSRDDMPALYDLFHFIYQTNILVKKKPFAAIRREIDETLRLPQWERFLLEHDIDPGEAEQQYLLSTISHYLQEYLKEARGHHQAPLLMQAWCEALGFWMDYEGLLTQRQIVIQDVIHYLHNRPYAAMKLCAQDITSLPLNATLELNLPATAATSLVEYLRKHRCIERIREKHQSVARQVSLFLSGGGVVHIDCFSEIRNRSLVFADAAHIRNSARFDAAGIKTARVSDDLRYTRLYYLLRGLPMPRCYRDYYLSQNISAQLELADQMRAEGAATSMSLSALMQYDEKSRQQCIASLKQLPANLGLKGLLHRLQDGIDGLRSLLPQRGFIITFSGVEGSGKHTVIEATRHRINEELRLPVVVLPKRPSLLPAFKKSADNTITLTPSANEKHIGLLSGLRFIYSYIDYLIGQCYVQLRYVMRGYVVLYDHYFDFASRDKSSNVILPAAFTGWWYRFLLQPDLNVLLYAPAEVILQRKQELSAEDIEQLTGQYLALFEKLERRSGQGHFISVRNMRLGDTVERLFQHIKTQAEAAA